jgi:imidazolonepropionase-like amidohydrolase
MSNKSIVKITFIWLLCAYNIAAQTVTFPVNDIADSRSHTFAITNAKIFVDENTTIEKGTLLLKNNKVLAVGNNISLPADAIVIDGSGKWIYPSFIETESDYGMPAVASGGGTYYMFENESKKKGAFGWNMAIQPENAAINLFTAQPAKAEELRKAGFGVALSHHHDGIARGSSVLVALANGKEQNLVLKAPASAHFSFSKGSSTQSYPLSLMGAVALLRQTYLDADWYKNSQNKTEYNESLEAFTKNSGLPQIFEAGDRLAVIRASTLGREFGVPYIIVAGGNEYQKLNEIKNSNASLIVPLNFQSGFDVDDPLDAKNISLTELKHWEMAPANPAKLAAEGIEIALTSSKLKQKSDFLTNLRKAISYGLSEKDALKALTSTPAKMLNLSNMLGSLKPGMLANFLVCDDNIFAKEAQILENWIQGNKYSIVNVVETDLRGKYKTSIGAQNFDLNISGKKYSHDYNIIWPDSSKISPKVQRNGNFITLSFAHAKQANLTYRISAYIQGQNLKGTAQDASGTEIDFLATKVASNEPLVPKPDSTLSPVLGKMLYPFTAYGSEQPPQAENFIVKNATVWTNETEGILPIADVWVENGKIKRVGKNLNATGIKIIDANGKHLTSGIIDEHSHIALLAINEGGQSVSAEVRTADVLDPDDIDMYRQLAGGTTAAQLLHGSANSIGGQSSIIKFKWGQSTSNLLIPDAKPFIKFALGENVTRKAGQNSAGGYSPRYPLSRMGVEQVMTDAFTRAKAYDVEWKKYNSLTAKDISLKPRKDLELEALSEIINKKRFITCHSYVQSEINMMMKVAEAFNFRINTFTHILEGYKLADAMAKHGVGGSTFSDWWAYKMEVRDAIPHNAALMHKAGVTVAINSDDPEMARRLNQEAAKTILYGGLSETDAWKTVTLNPAKLLQLDHRMGSIKVGKDADLVLWNASPLSVYARVEKTIIEGATYFDIETDQQKQQYLQAEKARIIKKMAEAKGAGSPTIKPAAPKAHVHDCADERSGL